MSCSKHMYQPQKCDGQPCPGDCDSGCPLAREWWEEECCNTCKKKMELITLDYSGQGCEHTVEDGYACLALAYEGVVFHVIGRNPAKGMCEEYKAKEQK